MTAALQVLLIAVCVQGLVKFTGGFLIPRPIRIRRMGPYYSRGGTIQIFFHRFSRPLRPKEEPETPTPPRKLISHAIQADPAPAWREIAFMSVLSMWALVTLLTNFTLTEEHFPTMSRPKQRRRSCIAVSC